MLTPALALYLYIIPAGAMAVWAWAYVFFGEEDAWFYGLLTLVALVIYPLWVWWWGALPTQLMSLETLVLGAACIVLWAVGAIVAAITDGTF